MTRDYLSSYSTPRPHPSPAATPGLTRAIRGTRSAPAGAAFGHGVSRCNVGGSVFVLSANTANAASTAPAAPSRCPVAPFVEDTESSPRRYRSWKTVAKARDSAASPTTVPVACALTYPTSSGRTPPSSSAARIARDAPAPSDGGCVMWCASEAWP
eukprot:31544-Pelagococcus_subviridis.AAC.2